MATGHLLGTLLPLNSVKLGRLVVNAGKPHEEFIDPLDGRPAETELIQNLQTTFIETRRFSKNSKLRTYLSDTLSFSFERQNDGSTTLSAPQAKSYDLPNSTTWFEDACAVPETRRFLEAAIDKSKRVYLVVGFRTVQDARLVNGISWAKTHRTGSVAIQTLVPRITGLAANLGAPGARFTRGAENGQRFSFEVPGEQVFSVLYREVKFKSLSSRKISDVSLGAGNRWVSCWDGWRGPNEEADGDGGDVIEANLTDLSDLEISDEEYSSGGEQGHEGRIEHARKIKQSTIRSTDVCWVRASLWMIVFLCLSWALAMSTIGSQ